MVSAPMGPIGILVIQRTLNKGKGHGFITGIGASCSDILYAIMVGFFMSFIVKIIESNQTAIQIIGAIMIIFFGIHIFKSKPKNNIYKQNVSPQKNSYLTDFATGFALCFSNPLIIFLFIALFARFNFFDANSSMTTNAIGILSIFVGALTWWTTLSILLGLVRNKFNSKSLSLINKIIGSILIIISLAGLFMSIFNITIL